MAFKIYPDSATSALLGSPANTPVDSAKMTQGVLALITDGTGPGSPGTPGYQFGTTLFIGISISLPASVGTPPQVTMHARNTAQGTVGSPVVVTATSSPGQALDDGFSKDNQGHLLDAAAVWFNGPGPYINNVYELQVFIEIDGTAIDIQIQDAGHDFVWVVADNEADTLQPWIQLTPFTPFGVLVNTTASANTQALQINNRGTGTLTINNIIPALTAPYKLNPTGALNSGLPNTIDPNPAPPLPNVLIGFDAPAAKGSTPVTNYTVDGDPAAVTGAGHNNAFSLSATTSQVEVVMLLDTSGSMAATDTSTPGASRLSELQSAASQVLSYLSQFAAGAGNKIGVVQFPGSDPNNPSTFDVVKSEDIPAMMTTEVGKINALTATDSTPMDGGLVEVLNTGYFSSDTTNARWLLLMSDGAWNVGNDPHTELSKLVTGNIVVFAAGYGQVGQVDYKTLTDLSVNSGIKGCQAFQVDIQPGALTYIQLAQKFKNAVAAGLALTSASDPDGVISPGGEDRYQVIITPYDRKAVFSLNWQTPNAGLTLTLLTPTCDVITPDSKIPGVTFISDPRYQMYGIDESYLQSRHGTWRLVVSFPEIILEARPGAAAPATGEHYSYSVLTDSSLKLRVELDKSTYFAGDTIGVTAKVTAGGVPVTGASAQLSLTAPGQSMDNWLAGIPITDAEYKNAAAQLAGKDAWPVYVKAFAAQLKGFVFNGGAYQTSFPMTPVGQTGAYFASVNQTTIPDGHTLYVTVTGTTSDGVIFRREASVDVHIGVMPDAVSTLFNIGYGLQNNPKMVTGVVSVTPRDRFGNVILIDPATSQYIQLQAQGATLDPKLATTFNGTYTSNVTYPAGTTPTFTLIVGGQPVLSNKGVVPVDQFNWVNEVVSFNVGMQGGPGANQHTDPTDALGDIRTRPANTFVSLGAYGSLAVAIKGKKIRAQGDDDITVFVESTLVPRSYLVEALAHGPDCDHEKDGIWVKIGTSPGGTSSFGLGKGGFRAASAIRITDTSGLTRDSQFNPLPDPGVDVIAVGAKSLGDGDGDGDICIRIRVLNSTGQPLGGTVDIEFQPQAGGQATRVKGADASKDIDVKGLARFPQVSVYEVTVTPTSVFKPTSQFVTIPASGFNTVVFTIGK